VEAACGRRAIVRQWTRTPPPALAPDAANADWLTRRTRTSIPVAPLVGGGDRRRHHGGRSLLMDGGPGQPYEPRAAVRGRPSADRAGAAIGLLADPAAAGPASSPSCKGRCCRPVPPSEAGSRSPPVSRRAPGADVGGDWWECEGPGQRPGGDGDRGSLRPRDLDAASGSGGRPCRPPHRRSFFVVFHVRPRVLLARRHARLCHEIMRCRPSFPLEERAPPTSRPRARTLVEPAWEAACPCPMPGIARCCRRRGGAVSAVWLAAREAAGAADRRVHRPRDPAARTGRHAAEWFHRRLVEARDRDLGEGIDCCRRCSASSEGTGARRLADEASRSCRGRTGVRGRRRRA